MLLPIGYYHQYHIISIDIAICFFYYCYYIYFCAPLHLFGTALQLLIVHLVDCIKASDPNIGPVGLRSGVHVSISLSLFMAQQLPRT